MPTTIPQLISLLERLEVICTHIGEADETSVSVLTEDMADCTMELREAIDTFKQIRGRKRK